MDNQAPFLTRAVHRRRKRRIGTAAMASPLLLVSAEYEIDVGVTLTFGRAIDITDVAPAEIVVEDGVRELLFAGSAASLLAPGTVLIELFPAGESSPSSQVLLSATSATGIVAAGGGTAWAGVSGLELPFGE